MKNYKKILLPLICFTLLFSCDKDSDSDNTNNNTPTNYILYENTYYDIGGPCIIEDYGQIDENLYNLDITNFSPNVYLADEGLVQYDTLVNDHYLYFELFSSEMMLTDGQYNFDTTVTAMTFDIGEFEVFNESTGYGWFVEFTSGTVNIDIENTSMVLDIEGTTDENKEISAHWEGSYNYFDDSQLIDAEPDFKKKNRINL
jgi:hypothetical protein